MEGDRTRYISVAAGCFMVVSSGYVGGFMAAENDMKDFLSLSQRQVELILGAFNLGYSFQLPCGFLWERVGPRWSCFTSLLIGSLSCLILHLFSFNPEYFGSAGFWWTIIVFFILGISPGFMLLNAISVCSTNFRSKKRGTVIGVVAASFFLGLGIFNLVYKCSFTPSKNYSGYLLLGIFIFAFANLVGMTFLKIVPIDECTIDTDSKVETEDSTTEDTASATMAVTDSDSDRSTKQKLLSSEENLQLHYMGELSLLEAVKTLDFHLICWSTVFTNSVGFSYTFNLPVFLKSFKLDSYEAVLVTAGTITAACAKFLFGFVSDKTLTKYPRCLYYVVTIVIVTITMFLSIFIGDKLWVVVPVTVIMFLCVACGLAIMPMVIADTYGTTHQSSIFGFIYFLTSIFNLIYTVSLGALYDAEIEGNDNTCYGLKCYRVIFIIATVLGIVSVGLLGYLYRETTQCVKDSVK